MKTTPNNNTGKYYGNASNVYSKGTKYYEIKGESSSAEIAVEESEDNWVKAVYSHDAPFHIFNLVTNPIIITFFGFLIAVLVIVSYKKFK